MGRGMVWPQGQSVTPANDAACGVELRLPLKVGSVVLLSGAAANDYEHAIPAVITPRISLTFRILCPEGESRTAQTVYCEAVRKSYRAKRKESTTAPKKPKGSGPTQAEKKAAKKAAKLAQSQLHKLGAADFGTPSCKITFGKDDGLPNVAVSVKYKNNSATTCVVSAARKARVPFNLWYAAKTMLPTAVVETKPKTNARQKICPKCPDALLRNTAPGAASESASRALPAVEIEHVQKVYDSVAREWHGTRYRTWDGVEKFIAKQSRDSLVADVGCGNGKNMPSVQVSGSIALGSDFSSGLISICAERGLEVKVADAVNLPYRSNVFDYALNIAVLHHISSETRRIMLVEETMRVLCVGGVALFYAWAQEQIQGGVSGHKFEAPDVLVPFHKRSANGEAETSAPAHTVFDQTKGSTVFQRYCHVYKEGELAELFKGLTWCKVESVYYDCGNWCVEVRKIADGHS